MVSLMLERFRNSYNTLMQNKTFVQMQKKVLYWIVGIITLVLILTVSSSEYFLRYAMHRYSDAYDIEERFTSFKSEYPQCASWIDSIRQSKALRDTFVMNRDGLKIHAFYLASPDSISHTAVIVHGHRSSAIDMMHIGYMYNKDLRWNIILPDLVAHGQSEGEWIGMGWKDRLDVIQWVRVANGTFPSTEIVVHGISMGAATTMCVSGEKTPDYVKAFIADCGYTSVFDEFAGEMKKQFHLPTFPMLNILSLTNKIKNGWSFQEASPLHQIIKSNKPLLLIYGDTDNYVPTTMAETLYGVKTGKKSLWLAPGSRHANAYKDHPEEYTAKVKNFLNEISLF